jgi:2,3-bisphosphoglycerate-independent phosphoglycerate mutase
MGKLLTEIYPVGDGESKLKKFIEDSINLLDDLPYNRMCRNEGKMPANMLWPWSPGRAPQLTAFSKLRGVTGAVISAVDVVRGLGVLSGLEIINVPGATGYFDTNYAGKGKAAIEALNRHDFVWVHVESPDEAGHAGSIDEKIRGIENFDRHVVGTIIDEMKSLDDYRLLCAPDHKTPISTRGHEIGPVPFLLYDSRQPIMGGGKLPYDERGEAEARVRLPEGYRLIDDLFRG